MNRRARQMLMSGGRRRYDDYDRYGSHRYDMPERYRGRHYDDYEREDDYEDCGRLSKRDMKEWEHNLCNVDGTHGAHFDKEQIEQVARSLGVEPKEYGDCTLYMTVNMMYSDYEQVAKKFGVDRVEFYIELAKAFLHDKDFDGDGAEKLYLYYTFIADNE